MRQYAVYGTNSGHVFAEKYSFQRVIWHAEMGHSLLAVRRARNLPAVFYRLASTIRQAQLESLEPYTYRVRTLQDVDNIKPQLVFAALIDNDWNHAAAARQIGVGRSSVNKYCFAYGFREPGKVAE